MSAYKKSVLEETDFLGVSPFYWSIFSAIDFVKVDFITLRQFLCVHKLLRFFYNHIY